MPRNELRRSRLGDTLKLLYGIEAFRSACIKATLRLEGGQFYSSTLRDILFKYHGISVGAYTYGECMIPGTFPPGVTIGRYVSMGAQVRAFLRNHPLERLSMHPFFYNKQLGYVEKDTITSGTLTIEADTWIGYGALILAGCKRIGVGAVVGAGAVVTKDVDDFGVVAGNPARLLRYRFPESVREVVLASKWWERSANDCVNELKHMVVPVGEIVTTHPLLRPHLKSSVNVLDI